MEWVQFFVAAVASGIFGGALATYLRTRPQMRAVELQGEDKLWAEIATLRGELKAEREECDKRIERIEERADAAVKELKAQIQVLRHDRNNTRQALNAMFAMLKQEGAEVSNVIATIETMLKDGDEVIALEKAAIAVGPAKGTKA